MKFDRHEGSNISHPHTKFQPSPFLGSPATADTTLPRAQRGLGAGFSGRNTRSKRSQSRKSAEKAVFIGKTFLFVNRFAPNLLHAKKTPRRTFLPIFSFLPSSVRPREPKPLCHALKPASERDSAGKHSVKEGPPSPRSNGAENHEYLGNHRMDHHENWQVPRAYYQAGRYRFSPTYLESFDRGEGFKKIGPGQLIEAINRFR